MGFLHKGLSLLKGFVTGVRYPHIFLCYVWNGSNMVFSQLSLVEDGVLSDYFNRDQNYLTFFSLMIWLFFLSRFAVSSDSYENYG